MRDDTCASVLPIKSNFSPQIRELQIKIFLSNPSVWLPWTTSRFKKSNFTLHPQSRAGRSWHLKATHSVLNLSWHTLSICAESDWTNKLMPETLSDTLKQQQRQVSNGRRHTKAMMTWVLCIGGEEYGNVVSTPWGLGAIIQQKQEARQSAVSLLAGTYSVSLPNARLLLWLLPLHFLHPSQTAWPLVIT